MTHPGNSTPALLVALLLACSSNKSPESTDVEGGDSGQDPTGAEAYPEIAECVGDLNRSDVEWELLILQETADSLHEMVACGGLYFNLLSDLSEVLVNFAVEGAEGVKVPEGYVYAGGGVYQSTATGTRMDILFSFGADYDAGAYGEPVTADLFDMESYLLNATVELDYETFEVLVYHDGPGPLVELLGRSKTPDSPMRLGSGEVEDLSVELGKLLVDMDIVVEDDRGVTVVSYALGSPQATVSASLESGLLPMTTLEGAAAENGDTLQGLLTTDWLVEYESMGSLDGTIGFSVMGGAFDYTGIWTYNHAGFPTTTLACAP